MRFVVTHWLRLESGFSQGVPYRNVSAASAVPWRVHKTLIACKARRSMSSTARTPLETSSFLCGSSEAEGNDIEPNDGAEAAAARELIQRGHNIDRVDGLRIRGSMWTMASFHNLKSSVNDGDMAKIGRSS
jgi:hypothetical protein